MEFRGQARKRQLARSVGVKVRPAKHFFLLQCLRSDLFCRAWKRDKGQSRRLPGASGMEEQRKGSIFRSRHQLTVARERASLLPVREVRPREGPPAWMRLREPQLLGLGTVTVCECATSA